MLKARGLAVVLAGLVAAAAMGPVLAAASDPGGLDTGDLTAACAVKGAPAAKIEACDRLLGTARRPDDIATLHFFRALAEADLGRNDDALADVDTAVATQAGLVPARWLRAVLLAERRRYGDAVADWSALVAAHPDMIRLYFYRGAALNDAGDSTAALADYDKLFALSGAGESAEDFVDRAEARLGVADLDGALADLGEAVKRAPQNADALAGRGRIEYLRGDFPAAAADLAKADEFAVQRGYVLLWLYLADARSGGGAETMLRRRADAAGLKQWPRPIVDVLVGDAKPETVAAPTEPSLWSEADRKAGAQCELAFYRGEQALAKGDRKLATSLFAAVIASGFQDYVEYRAAKVERARLGGK